VSEDGRRYPLSIVRYSRDGDRMHPTQKPGALMEYMIRTYSNEGEVVLDNCMGSGTTGVACANTGRRFIGIEREPNYFDIAQNRIQREFDGGSSSAARTVGAAASRLTAGSRKSALADKVQEPSGHF